MGSIHKKDMGREKSRKAKTKSNVEKGQKTIPVNRKVRDLKQYFFVIRELTSREIKRKYARSSLGIIWSVLNPLLTMVVMSLIFSTMFKRTIENYPIYLLTGQMIWTLFSTATNSSMTALVDNKNLLIKAKLPKQTFVLSRVYTAIVNFAYTFVAYIVILVVFRIKPNPTMLLLPVDVIYILMFSVGLGYVLSVMYVFFADIKYLYSVLLTMWMYLSAIFYPVSGLSVGMQKAIEINPIYEMIFFARECILYGSVPNREIWVRLSCWSVGMLVAGLLIFRYKENQIMQKV